MRLAKDQRNNKLAIDAITAILTSKLTRIVLSEPIWEADRNPYNVSSILPIRDSLIGESGFHRVPELLRRSC